MISDVPESYIDWNIVPPSFNMIYQEALLEGLLQNKIFVKFGYDKTATPYLLQYYADGRIEIFVTEDE